VEFNVALENSDESPVSELLFVISSIKLALGEIEWVKRLPAGL
jgi:hypothetical protein